MWQGIGQLFLGSDGGADEFACAAILGVLVFLGLSILAYGVRGQAFDPMAFGTGLGAAIGGAAAGMGIKSRMEEKDADGA